MKIHETKNETGLMAFRHKYRAKKVQYDNFTFASKMEAAVYQLLKLRENNGEIKDLKCQESVYLTEARILYKPDFSYVDVNTNEKVYVESKGFETDVWRIKRRLWKFYGTGKLEIWKGTHNRPYLFETIDTIHP